MIAGRASFRYLRQAAFLGLCLTAIYLPMTPLAPGSDRIAPDALFCVVMAWVLRDPLSAPLWMILAAALAADILLARPIGLGALGLVIASEIARTWRGRIAGINLVVEWIAVLAIFCLVWLGMLALLKLSFAAVPELDTLLRLVAETALLYPVISLAMAIGLRIFGPRHAARNALRSRDAW